MRWHKIGRILVVCGVLMVTFGVSVLPAQGAEPTRSAQPLLAPSPRPTLGPTRPRGGGSQAGPVSGRITGTIIDLTTGAPTPGVQVSIGGTIVTSDANGNYDLWVPVGAYNVALALNPQQGAPDQGEKLVDIAAGQTTVLHLNFHTPLAPSATPAAPTATAVPVKTATPVEARGKDRPAPRAPVTPRLPRTGEQDSNAWLWMTFGALLVMGGVALEYGRTRRLAGAMASAGRARSNYDNARLLARLLAANMQNTQPVRARAAESDILLAALLAADTGEG